MWDNSVPLNVRPICSVEGISIERYSGLSRNVAITRPNTDGYLTAIENRTSDLVVL